MNSNTGIKTTKTIYPQIYAYVLPDYPPQEGWVKIGYTEQKNVEDRIKQQTQTANIAYRKLWSGPAKYLHSDEWFIDKHLHTYLRNIKNIKQKNRSEWFYYDGNMEQSFADYDEFRQETHRQTRQTLEYQLRAEQEEAVQRTLLYAQNHPGGEFLWNAKPRFGKTLSAYDLARKLNAKNVLVVTNRPAIANSWFDDFETFIEWQTNYRFVSTTDSLKDRPVLTREEYVKLKPNADGIFPYCISFISLQDLKGAIGFGGTYNKLRWVKDLSWDLLIIDEAHEGVDTLKTDVAFNNISRKFTLHLSGTPFRALGSGKFAEEQIYNWTYADEQDAKTTWSSEREEANPYAALPRLSLFSYRVSEMITDEVNRGAQVDGRDIDFAFDLNEFFATNESGSFIHEAEIIQWLDTLTENEKYPFSTPKLRGELKHTLWLLNRVASAKALERILSNHPVFKDYEIVVAAGDGRIDDDQIINQASLNRVREAINHNDRTITLSVGQLTTGVTVPEWTAVFMLSNVKSASLYMQAAFRSQNQWTYTVDGKMYQKQNAYVFDFAPERTLIMYDEFANNLNTKTVDGGGTTEDRETNIRKLLNFFPVIAEDSEGVMVELDVKQLLTIPKTIKAQEVVKRGFMSNFLFQNISGIFASEEVREILEQLNPVPVGKVTPQTSRIEINTHGVQVDSNGIPLIDNSIILAETDARFGEKVYEDLINVTQNALEESSERITNIVAAAFTQSVLGSVKELAKENKVTVAQAEFVVSQHAGAIAREIEIVKRQAEIEHAEALEVYRKAVAEAQNDPVLVAEAEEKLGLTKSGIKETLKEEVTKKVEEKTVEFTRKSVEEILQKGEERKKNTVEDDIRSRLRGFARTIPSFLMAYGTRDTTLATFDEKLTDEVFKEVTGITLDQFRALRDTYDFFNPVVFDEAIQEFLRKKEKLADYFDESQTEDIFDYIPPQKTNQIYTPRWVVKLMIDKLEEENPGIFKNDETTFADLYVKSGLYLTEIAKRLFEGLEHKIPDKEKRLKHILENQVFGFAPSEIIYNIAKNFVFGMFDTLDTSTLQFKDLTEIAKNKERTHMKFDVVVGNPPYQETGLARDNPIYHYFYDLAETSSKMFCLISPGRFLFNAGQTPKGWNKKMLSNQNMRVVYYEQDSSRVFPSTDIKGGVVIVYYNSNHTYSGMMGFSRYEELNSIVEKVDKTNSDRFSEIVQPQGIYRFTELFFRDFPKAESMQGKGTKRKIVSRSFSKMDFVFRDEKLAQKDINFLGLEGGKRSYKWIPKKYVLSPVGFSTYRVLISESNGTGAFGEVLSTPFVEKPFVGHTDTFLSIGTFDSISDAQNCLTYIKTKFCRALLGVLKVTQHNSRNTWSKVPLQDFTPQSDIDWSKSIPEIDQQLYAKYGLDEKEIAFIEAKVKEMTQY